MFIYEIYPQSELPLLTQIAHLEWTIGKENPAHLLSDKLIFRDFLDDRIVFRFWDYRANYSTCFSVSADLEKPLGTFATKTAIIVFCAEGISIWAIPPLLPHSPDHFLDDNPIHLPPLFRIPFPDDTIYPDIHDWKTISPWYSGSRESIYFDILRLDSKLDRFKLIVKPDLSEASLHPINASKLTPREFDNVSFPSSYRICEDTISSFWSNSHECGVHTGLTSTLFSDSTLRYWITKHNHSLCPASGRFVYFAFSHEDPSVVVMDLIWFYYSGSKPEEPNYWKDTVIDVLKYSSIYLRII